MGWETTSQVHSVVMPLGVHKACSHIREGESFCSKETCLIWFNTAFPKLTGHSTLPTGFSEHVHNNWSGSTSNTQQNQNDVPDPPTINTAFFQYIIPNALNSAGKQRYINLNVRNVKHPRQLELETTLRAAHIWSVSEPLRAGSPWLLPPPWPSQEEEQKDK